uniref:Uncharacterized protein n=1 Tax=Ciona savignyi TaxID=51511 RepID=H2ZKA7_CIOSA
MNCLASTVYFLLTFTMCSFANPLYKDDSNSNTEYYVSTDDYEYETEYADSDPRYKCPTDVNVRIKTSRLCDGFPDCSDASDEDRNICAMYEIETTDSPAEMIHEIPTTTADPLDYLDYGECEEGTFQCPSHPGLCLASTTRCDGRTDCPGGEDEDNCHEVLRRPEPESIPLEDGIRMSRPLSPSAPVNGNSIDESTATGGENARMTTVVVDPLANNVFYARKSIVPFPPQSEYDQDATSDS